MKNFMSKLTGFTLGMARWVNAGRPIRSPEWVAELFEHCWTCPSYEPDKRTEFRDRGVCAECGCYVHPTDLTIRNKLVLPTEGCPRGHWHASVDINRDNINNKRENDD